jgi:hypothetical protein
MSPDSERDLVLLARVFARTLYGDDVRDDVHLQSYAEELVKQVMDRGGSKVEIIAAYVRDALKYGYATEDEIRAMFGEDVLTCIKG